MRNLLKLEFRKLKKQKSFYICGIIMVLLVFLSALTTKVFINADSSLAAQFSASGISGLINALDSSSFLLIIGIFTALTVCDDYEQQTVKTILARGYSRKNIYLAKLIAVFACTSFLFIIVEAAAFAINAFYFGIGDPVNFKFLCILAVQYLTVLANVALFFAISSILRKNGSSIAATIVAPMLINMVLGLADSFLKLKDFSLTSLWLSSMLSDLSVLTVSMNRMIGCIAASVIYILVFIATGAYFNNKIEL